MRTEDIATVAAETYEVVEMEIARIVLDYVKVLAWPSVVAMGLLLFRRELQNLVATLQHLKLPGGAEMDWQRQIQATEQAAEKVEAEQPRPLPRRGIVQRIYDRRLMRSSSDYDFSYYEKIAETDPNLALAGVRMELEPMLRNLATVYQVDYDERAAPMQVARLLREQGVLRKEEDELLRQIISVASRAVHGQDVSREDALRTIKAAEIFRDAYLAHMAQKLEGS
jgi:hypothetical protein